MEKKIFGIKIPEIRLFSRKKPLQGGMQRFWDFAPDPYNPGYVEALVMKEIGFPVELKIPDTGGLATVMVDATEFDKYSGVIHLLDKRPESTLLYEVWRSAPNLVLDFVEGRHFNGKQPTTEWIENNHRMIQGALKAAYFRAAEYLEGVKHISLYNISDEQINSEYVQGERIEEPELTPEEIRLIIRKQIEGILGENTALQPKFYNPQMI